MYRDDEKLLMMNLENTKINRNDAKINFDVVALESDPAMSEVHSDNTGMNASPGIDVVSSSVENSITPSSAAQMANEGSLGAPLVEEVAEASGPMTTISIDHSNVIEANNVHGTY